MQLTSSMKEKRYFKDKSKSIISYSYTLPMIASNILYYQRILQDLEIEDFKVKTLTVLAQTLHSNNAPGHAIMGYLNTIENESLLCVCSKGHKDREPRSIE